MENIISALQCILSPATVGLMLIGLTMGIIMGAIPGLGGGIGITLMLPLTFKMDSTTAIAFLMAISVGGISGGYIGSVLLGIPGDTTSLSTVLDGYPMTKKGETVRALSVCTVCNYLATVPSILLAMFASPLIASIAVKLGPWEFFGLCVFALSMIISLSKQNIFKGLIAMGLGFVFSSIGTDPLGGIKRFTFGSYQLSSGLNIVSVMLGLFAGCSILMEFARGGSSTLSETIKISRFKWPGKDLLANKLNIVRSWIIGAVIGFLPGMGATLANVVAYAQAKSASKHPEEFGKGSVEGVIAPETANNASIGGALIPLLSLGIPGDGNTALLLAALTIQGVQAGPLMIRNYPVLVYVCYIAALVAATDVFLVEILGMPVFPALLKIPYHYLYPAIIALIFLGAYVNTSNMFGIYSMVFLALFGVLLNFCEIPGTPFMLSFVLGNMIETYLRRGLSYAGWTSFLSRPVSCIFIICAVISILWALLAPIIKKNQKNQPV